MTHDDSDIPDEPPLTAEDIEAAYERALMAMDSVESAVDSLSASVSDEAATDDDPPPAVHDPSPLDAAEIADPDEPQPAADAAPVLHPREIIEAALFVGGQSLTTRRLGQMLGPHETPDRIDEYIAELNAVYRDEQRPYEIDFGEGGYRLVLHAEFEPVRNAVFGAAPKEVKLSQDALEVLAFVAYRQPATKEDLEEAGKDKAAGLLRQLIRRELIALDRTDGLATYSTTDRFLELFGLRSLDDLPFPEDLELK